MGTQLDILAHDHKQIFIPSLWPSKSCVLTTCDFVAAGHQWLCWRVFPTTGCLVMFVSDFHGSYSMLDNKCVLLPLQTNILKGKV